jgi:hypothetical protein
MPRTFSRPSLNIRPSDVYDDTLPLANAELSPATLEDDLNFIRTALRDLKGSQNWFDAAQNAFNLRAIYDKRFTFWVQKSDIVHIGANSNFVLLTGAAKPVATIASSSSTLGAIVAKLPGVVGAHSLIVLSDNGNLCEVRLSGTNESIYVPTGEQIYALLQVGSNSTDGNVFGDTSSDDQAQLSFVYFDALTNSITACDPLDVASKSIEYAFRKRTDFYSLPENAFDPSITFTESSAKRYLQFSRPGELNPGTFLLNGYAMTSYTSGARVCSGCTMTGATIMLSNSVSDDSGIEILRNGISVATLDISHGNTALTSSLCVQLQPGDFISVRTKTSNMSNLKDPQVTIEL